MRASLFVVLVSSALVLCAAAVADFALVGANAASAPHDSSQSSSPSREPYNSHYCIHDELQRRVAQTGLPTARVVKLSNDGAATATSATPDQTYLARGARVMADEWQPVRIGLFTNDLFDNTRFCGQTGQTVPDFQGGTTTCADKDLLTDERRTTLTDYLLPMAIRTHAKYLLVRPVTGALVIPDFGTGGICGSFTVPGTHRTDGITGFDFAIYTASVPTRGAVVAWASACATFTDGRPIAGVINVAPRSIQRNGVTVRTVTHEMLHALGFSQQFFTAANMIQQVASIRGKPGPLFVINGTNVVRETRRHYNCDTLQWMELEDEGSGNTANSHWERRNAKDELMSGITGISYYTAITIAAMEDLGYYKGNYTDAEIMSWGRNAGCDLLNEKCMTNNITKYPAMFCNDSSVLRCSSDRTGAGTCIILTPTDAVPSYFQYFADPDVWGSPNMVDRCPIVENAVNAACTDASNRLPGSLGGASMTCFDADNLPYVGTYTLRALCAEVNCNKAASTYQVRVQGSGSFVSCPAGTTLSLNAISSTISSGTITCPPYNEVCQVIAAPTNPPSSATSRVGASALLTLTAVIMAYFAV